MDVLLWHHFKDHSFDSVNSEKLTNSRLNDKLSRLQNDSFCKHECVGRILPVRTSNQLYFYKDLVYANRLNVLLNRGVHS